MVVSLTQALALASGASHAAEPGTGVGLEPPDTVACPDNPLILNDFYADGIWRHPGSSESQDAHGEGTCGGGAGDVVYHFVAPDDGDYTFRVQGSGPDAEDADPVLYLRTACGPEGEELACADDGLDGTLAPEIAVTLARDQALFVFVDGYLDEDAGAWRGAYTLLLTTERIAGPPEVGPYLHICRCPGAERIAVCSDTPCDSDEVCAQQGCLAQDTAVRVDCYANQAGCAVPDPPAGGTALLYCECASGYNPALTVDNAVCDGVNAGDASAAEVQCAAHCRAYGLGSGTKRTLCQPDHVSLTDRRVCPDPTTLGGLPHWNPLAICSPEDAEVLNCPVRLTPGSAFYALDGCGCGCLQADTGCPDPEDPGVAYRSRDPQVCTTLPFECAPGETKFFSPLCGCGCQSPPDRLCTTPGVGPGGEPDDGFRVTGDWPACWEAYPPPCVEGESHWALFDCSCGCITSDYAALGAGDAADPSYFLMGALGCAGGNLRCPDNSMYFGNPVSCGCSFDTGVCPERGAAARIVSDDFQTCLHDGVHCPPGEYPFIHPVCGCGCIPNPPP